MIAKSPTINENEKTHRLSVWKISGQKVRQFAYQWYWLLIIIFGAFIILLETAEHILELLPTSDLDNLIYIAELFFSLCLLAISGFLVRLLLITLESRNRVIHTLNQKHALAKQLAITQDINEIARQIIHFTASITPPSVEVRLYIYDRSFDRYLQVGQPGMDGKAAVSASIDGYSLPLVRGAWPVGLLNLHFLGGIKPDPKKIALLEDVSEEMSSALGIAIEKQAREEIALAQTVNAVQLDLARDLHDTIGQSISYLLLKLDRLPSTCPNLESETRMEIARMYDVAHESYDLVRGTLAVLQSGSSASLQNLLAGHAENVARRVDFKVDFASQGKPMSLTPRQMRQLFYIFREALSNVEKHARARHVCIELIWAEQNLLLTITDDGCGFDQDLVPGGLQGDLTQGVHHYGLKFMRERTEKINGEFSIRSAPGSGTNISIRLPYMQV